MLVQKNVKKLNVVHNLWTINRIFTIKNQNFLTDVVTKSLSWTWTGFISIPILIPISSSFGNISNIINWSNFLGKIQFFGQNSIFWAKFNFLDKIQFFGQNSIFWAKFNFFGQKSIFWAKIHLLCNFH